MPRLVADAGDDEQLPCGKRETTGRAVGRRAHVEAAADREHRNVRQRAGAEISAAGRAGQPSQKSALPNRYAQFPNGPKVPAGSAATRGIEERLASLRDRSVAGHGNGPSRQTVAA